MEGHEVPTREMIKTPEDIEALREAGKMNAAWCWIMRQNSIVRAGISTEELDLWVYRAEHTQETGRHPGAAQL